MLKIDRQKYIEEALKKQGSVLISDISRKLSCSEETVRRDLTELASQKKLKRIHGGAYLPEDYDKSVPIQLRETLFSDVKQKMAAYVYQHYINQNEIIVLDSSTTCLALAQQILQHNRKLTIITNSLRICNMYAAEQSNIKVICTGGILKLRTGSFVGYQTVKELTHYVADKCFISCPVVDVDYGLMDNNNENGEIRRTMLEHARQKIIIADHTKFHEQADVIIGRLDTIDALITNKKPALEWSQASSDYDFELITVK